MGFVVTKDSTVVCAHQGTVTLVPSQTKLTVGGAAVLVAGDIAGKPIGGCLTVPSIPAGTVACAATASELPGGTAHQLTVGGKPVLLDSVNGLTAGTVTGTPQTWSVQSVGQNKLQTV